MRQPPAPLGEALDAWTPSHTLGAAVVVLILLAIAATIWPGWQRVLSTLGI